MVGWIHPFKHISFSNIWLGSFFCLISSVLQAQHYLPRVELQSYWGNHRSLGRIGLLQPFWSTSNQLLYGNAYGLWDSRRNGEGNVGLGYRALSSSGIIGGFMHYDVRRSGASHHLWQQWTTGLECVVLP